MEGSSIFSPPAKFKKRLSFQNETRRVFPTQQVIIEAAEDQSRLLYVVVYHKRIG